MTEKDKHVQIICEKYEAYKLEMDSKFNGDDYPFHDLEPWTNYYVEGHINQEDLDFEKWYDENIRNLLYKAIKQHKALEALQGDFQ
jgi:hypothetical protein